MKKENHFASGMLVVCTKSSTGGFREGHIYKVVEDYGDSLTVECDSGGDANGWNKENFRHITMDELECLILSCKKVLCELPGNRLTVIINNINRELNQY